MLLIVLFEVVPFGLGAVSSDGRNVDQARPVLNESPSLDRDFDVSKVVEAKLNEFSELFLSQEILNGLRVKSDTEVPMSCVPLTATRPFSLKK